MNSAIIWSATRKQIALLCLLVFATFISKAQFSKVSKVLNNTNGVLKSGAQMFHSGAQAINEFGKLVAATKRTTAEFNSSVRVVYTSPSLSNIPSSKIIKPQFKHGKFTNFKWAPRAEFDGQLFPAMIISMSKYRGVIYDEAMKATKGSALGFYFYPTSSYIPVKWEIESVDKSFFDKVSGDFNVGNEIYGTLFTPPIPWNMSVLAKQGSSANISIVYRIYDEEGNKEELSETILIHSVNDCIYRYQQTPYNFLFTAFIQEQHPEVDKILRDALNTNLVSSFDGYGTKSDTLQVLRQVGAIWRVLHDRGFQYSNVAVTSVNSDINISSQQIRTFDNALKTNQANCVDGTVVFASILRAIGLSTVMLVTPRHCFLGFYKSKTPDKELAFLETTDISNSEFIDNAKTPKEKAYKYNMQFQSALTHGRQKYDEYVGTDSLMVINVDACRDFIVPLPFN